MSCKVIGRFVCVYVVAKGKGFHMGNVEVSCEHCLDSFLADFGGVVIYKKRFKEVPPWRKMAPILEKAGREWMEGVHPACGNMPPPGARSAAQGPLPSE